jgi:hypothetical protein
MFVIDQSPAYEWPVRFVQAAEEGGKHVEHGFTATFKRYKDDELDALAKQATAPANRPTDKQVAQKLLAGWNDICDSSGQALPFTPANVARVLAVPGVAKAVIAAFFDSLGKAAEKN